MSWTVIARQDGRQTLGAKSVKYLLGLLVLVVMLTAYIYPITGEEPITTARFTGYVTGWLTTLIPLVGILVGYNAVVSERESGALRLSLALPHSRRDILVGKLAGRAGVLAGTVLAVLVAAGALVVYPYGDLELPRSLAFIVLTVGFSLLWTGLGVAVSLSVATKQQALVLAFGFFFIFVFAWGTVESALEFGLNAAGVIDGDLPGAVQFLFGLSPNKAYTTVTDGFLNPAASVSGQWYANEWTALVVFLTWLVVPLGLAYLRFAGRDLA